jgi:O-acetyl-ADP-ribose deacetylase (regulator of RNase III)
VDVEVECMVNAANTLSFTPMDGGISGALRRACQPADVTGKEKIYWTAEGKEESAVKLPVTQAGVQPAAGGLAERGVKYIIHAVGPTWTDWSISEKTFTIVLPKIKQTVHRALDAAVRMKVRSVALPAISGGIFTHYRADQPQVKEREQRAARKAVLEAVLEWTTKNVGRNPTQGEESEQGARPESSLPDSSASASSSSAPPASSLTSILLCDLPKRQKGGMHMFVEEFAALVPSKEPTPSKARPAAPASSTAAAPAVARPNRPRRPAAAGPRPEWQDPIEKTNEDEEAGFRF